VLFSSVSVVDGVRDLGVVINSRLTMSDHVTTLCRSRYYQLRQLRPVAKALPEAAAKFLVQVFVSCRLDYCNAPFYGMTDNLFRRLQSIQNTAARLLTGTRRRDHISPVLSCLYWLPVKQRVVFKLAILVFKSLRGETTLHLADDCELIADSGRRRLRSADGNALTVSRTYIRLGDRSFSVVGLKVYGTVFRPHCENRTLNLCSSNDF